MWKRIAVLAAVVAGLIALAGGAQGKPAQDPVVQLEHVATVHWSPGRTEAVPPALFAGSTRFLAACRGTLRIDLVDWSGDQFERYTVRARCPEQGKVQTVLYHVPD